MNSYILQTLASQHSAEVAQRSRTRTRVSLPAAPTTRRHIFSRVQWQVPARARRVAG
jgi:hypothetical protein